MREPLSSVLLFLIAQQFSLWIPDLQAVPVNHVIIWTQRFGRFDRQFEGLKRLHGMTTVSRHVKRSVQAMILSGFSEKVAKADCYLIDHQAFLIARAVLVERGHLVMCSYQSISRAATQA
jgi:hypothetical protein